MKTIKWLVSLVPKQARTIVAALLIAISALSMVIVYLYKEGKERDTYYTEKIRFQESWYQTKLDSLNALMLKEKEQAKQDIIGTLQKVIDQQNATLEAQKKSRKDQRSVVNINNNIIQQNEQKIKLLQNE